MIVSLFSYAITSPDTLIYLTPQDAKIINLMTNELDKCTKLNLEKDTIIELKNAKISNLTKIEQMRSDQLIAANLQLAAKDKELKQLKRKLILYKIIGLGVSLGLMVSLI